MGSCGPYYKKIVLSTRFYTIYAKRANDFRVRETSCYVYVVHVSVHVYNTHYLILRLSAGLGLLALLLVSAPPRRLLARRRACVVYQQQSVRYKEFARGAIAEERAANFSTHFQ